MNTRESVFKPLIPIREGTRKSNLSMEFDTDTDFKAGRIGDMGGSSESQIEMEFGTERQPLGSFTMAAA